MNFLVVGSGGREHAIVKELKKSKKVTKIFSLPGSDAINLLADPLAGVGFNENSLEKIKDKIIEKEIEMVIIGPEAPLVWGLSDTLREAGVLVFGPDKGGAKLEGDKIFAKEFLDEFNIPTGKYLPLRSLDDLKKGIEEYNNHPFYVFKYSALAGGKGVLVTKDPSELIEFGKKYGLDQKPSAKPVAYLDEPLEGWELSCICIITENGYDICPILQDHKRLYNNDRGPNTGGMGVAGPIDIDPKLLEEIKKTIIEPSLEGLEARDIFYRGVLYIGVMVTNDGPKVLEYNVRFGDPETQLIFPLVESDWGEVFINTSLGKNVELNKSNQFGCCIVKAAEGYPDSPKKGATIEGEVETEFIYHAGTKFEKNKWHVNGGRVLNIIGLSHDLPSAIEKAYKNNDLVTFQGEQYRTDIGAKL